MVKSVLRGAVLLSGLLLVLSACGDGEADSSPSPSPSPSAPESSSAAASVSPSPTESVEPELPEAAKANDEAGAIAFVKHYWAMVNYAQATGDTEGLAKLAADGCSPCDGGLDGIRNVYEKGGKITGGDVSVVDVTARGFRLEDNSMRGYIVEMDAEVSASTTVGGPGEPDREFEAGPRSFTFTVEDRSGKWLVASWNIDE